MIAAPRCVSVRASGCKTFSKFTLAQEKATVVYFSLFLVDLLFYFILFILFNKFVTEDIIQ